MYCDLRDNFQPVISVSLVDERRCYSDSFDSQRYAHQDTTGGADRKVVKTRNLSHQIE